LVFGEDLSQIRTGNGPQVMANLRNLAITLHRLTGATNTPEPCAITPETPNTRSHCC